MKKNLNDFKASLADGLLHFGAFVWLGNSQRKTFVIP